MSLGGHKTGDAMTIVPTRSMQLIERALSESDAEIRVAARGNDILVKRQRASIFSRLVEGRFPKWRDVFPRRENTVKVQLAVGPFWAAVPVSLLLGGVVVYSGALSERSLKDRIAGTCLVPR